MQIAFTGLQAIARGTSTLSGFRFLCLSCSKTTFYGDRGDIVGSRLAVHSSVVRSKHSSWSLPFAMPTSSQIYSDTSPGNPLAGDFSVEELLEAFAEEVMKQTSHYTILALPLPSRILTMCVWGTCSHTETIRVCEMKSLPYSNAQYPRRDYWTGLFGRSQWVLVYIVP